MKKKVNTDQNKMIKKTYIFKHSDYTLQKFKEEQALFNRNITKINQIHTSLFRYLIAYVILGFFAAVLSPLIGEVIYYIYFGEFIIDIKTFYKFLIFLPIFGLFAGLVMWCVEYGLPSLPIFKRNKNRLK